MNSRNLWTVHLCVACALAGWLLVMALHAQEKPVRETRTWQLGTLPHKTTGFTEGPNQPVADIYVFDTEGVCVYIARTGTAVALGAVPKTQLPTGAGCQ